MPLTTLIVVPACGQRIEKARKLIWLVRATATGPPFTFPTLPATPPTLASAGQEARFTTSPAAETVSVTVMVRAVTPVAAITTVAV